MNEEKLKKPIGTKEPLRLKPAEVVVLGIEFDEVTFGKKTQEKVILLVKHPEADDPIKISKAKISVKKKGKEELKVTGLWYSEDEEGNISKVSALAEVLRFIDVPDLESTVGKKFETIEDEDGYLCFKAYK